jgi:hypothetical protein
MDPLLAELKKLFETLAVGVGKPPEITKEVEDAYKAHGFDAKKPPSDSELGKWATELIYNWYSEPNTTMNLPLAGLVIGFNMATWGKLNQFDQMNLKTLLSSVYNMGYAMALYKMKSPFDKKPQPQELN